MHLVSALRISPPRPRHGPARALAFPTEISEWAPAVDALLRSIPSVLHEALHPLLESDFLGQASPIHVEALQPLLERDFLGPLAGAWLLNRSGVVDWRGSSRKTPASPTPCGSYDAAAAQRYFAARPGQVASRLAQCALPTLRFGSALLYDYVRGESAAKARRAEQLVALLTELGPTFIKVGQALSIRADLIPAAYVAALGGLQDRVPPFSSEEARRIMAEEWRRDIGGLFASLSEEPVAAASLGQVYRGVLKKGGVQVAVKVQRPDTLDRISLDLLLLRAMAARLKEWRNLNSDLVGLVDDWGRGFVDELDYTKEADNQRAFIESIKETPLRDVVTAPKVIGDLSTDRVLTTEWIDGERLELSQAEDISKLCGIALNTYLTMLLSTGLLHCDPHPGNLLRTTEGKLCILDWGLVTPVDRDLQLTFLEHVAHLVAKDYAAVPADLVKLGFVPEGMEEAMSDSDVVETLANVYTQWAGGGGAAKIDVNEVSGRLQKLTEERGNFFQIPPYFAYILRAFSVLEGIALINDPGYSILNECLPYIAQRVITDSSPRAKSALRSFVYTKPPTVASESRLLALPGQQQARPHVEDAVLDAARLTRLVDGLRSFSASSGGLSLDEDAKLERLAKEIISLVLAREGSPLQDLILDETARLVDAITRDTVSRSLLPPLPLPAQSVEATRRLVDPTGLLSALLAKSKEDEAVLAVAQTLAAPFQQFVDSEASTSRLRRLLAAELWERRGDLPLLSTRLAARTFLRASDRLERTSSSLIHAAGAEHASARANGRSTRSSDASVRLASSMVRGALAVASSGLLVVSTPRTSRPSGP
ncbi:hypothetical protein AB1Y20_019674 [Prymnesium parvum]|uniref:Protein kinase domain-containing protein n=1 Tax=Prymnesium parvum TaxID=97485 RepID=A0AB34JRR3_PRYPA